MGMKKTPACHQVPAAGREVLSGDRSLGTNGEEAWQALCRCPEGTHMVHIYIYAYTHIYVHSHCVETTYRHISCQARDERGCDGVGDGGVGILRLFSRGCNDVKANEGIETGRSPLEHLWGGSNLCVPGGRPAPSQGEGAEQK